MTHCYQGCAHDRLKKVLTQWWISHIECAYFSRLNHFCFTLWCVNMLIFTNFKFPLDLFQYLMFFHKFFMIFALLLFFFLSGNICIKLNPVISYNSISLKSIQNANQLNALKCWTYTFHNIYMNSLFCFNFRS